MSGIRGRGFVPMEDAEQIIVMRWAELFSTRYPELELLYHIPNGSHKSIVTAAKFKKLGLKRGVPDLHLPVARAGHHSLYVEMKRVENGTLSKDQVAWHKRLRAEGNRVEVCLGAESAQDAIISYLTSR